MIRMGRWRMERWSCTHLSWLTNYPRHRDGYDVLLFGSSLACRPACTKAWLLEHGTGSTHIWELRVGRCQARRLAFAGLLDYQRDAEEYCQRAQDPVGSCYSAKAEFLAKCSSGTTYNIPKASMLISLFDNLFLVI